MYEMFKKPYIPVLTKQSYYIGGVHNSKVKSLNFFENKDYISTWETKADADNFLTDLLQKADENYFTKKDPFFHLLKTKGDWKNYNFIVVNLK
jgi:hypothetical protein